MGTRTSLGLRPTSWPSSLVAVHTDRDQNLNARVGVLDSQRVVMAVNVALIAMGKVVELLS